MNIWDILILLFIAGGIAAAVRVLRGEKRRGRLFLRMRRMHEGLRREAGRKGKDKRMKI